MNRRQFLRASLAGSAVGLAALASGAEAPVNTTVLNLDPTDRFPRNSEGAFATLKSGRVLFIYSQFYGGAADESPARLVSIYSDDAGRTWSPDPQVVVENTAGTNVMSVSLLRLQNGQLALFYVAKENFIECRPVVRLSTDEAATWSEARQMCEAPGYLELNNDRVIQLRSGRLVAPVAYYRSRARDGRSFRSFDMRAIALWWLSDDQGLSWREAKDWWALPVRSNSGLQEPGAVELADGRVWSWMRTDRDTQFATVSADGAERWSPPEPSSLVSPQSPASIKRLPGSNELLAVFNDHSGRFPFQKEKRTPLITAISADNGQTWNQRKLLENAPDGWYCYTAIHFVEDAVLLAYCAGDAKVGGLNRLRIRRVALDWLTAAG